MNQKSTLCNQCTDRSGVNNSNWKGGKYFRKAGYMMVRTPDRGYKFEHILVMEDHLGRFLLDGENVHHLNGIKDDNDISNLELWCKPQPVGIRATDALAWARETISRYDQIEDLL